MVKPAQLRMIHNKNSPYRKENVMKKWYAEEYEFDVEVTGFLRGESTEHYCRNGEEIGINTPVHMAAP